MTARTVTQTGSAKFEMFRLSNSKSEVDLAPNTLRWYHEHGLPFYHQGKAVFVSRLELAEFIKTKSVPRQRGSNSKPEKTARKGK